MFVLNLSQTYSGKETPSKCYTTWQMVFIVKFNLIGLDGFLYFIVEGVRCCFNSPVVTVICFGDIFVPKLSNVRSGRITRVDLFTVRLNTVLA